MRLLHFAPLVLALLLVLSGSALAETFTIKIMGSGMTQGIWGMEILLEVQDFVPDTNTPGSAVPEDWDLSTCLATVEDASVYRIILNQDLFQEPLSYLGDGQVLTLEYTEGSILGLHGSPIILEETSYDDLFGNPFQVTASSASGFTLRGRTLALTPINALLLE